MSLKPGLHIVVRVSEHACDDASKTILKPLTYIDCEYFLWEINIYDHDYHIETKP